MVRRIRNGVVAGLMVLGALGFAHAPASAEAAPAGGGKGEVTHYVTAAEAERLLAQQMRCRYAGYITDGNRIIHVIICEQH